MVFSFSGVSGFLGISKAQRTAQAEKICWVTLATEMLVPPPFSRALVAGHAKSTRVQGADVVMESISPFHRP